MKKACKFNSCTNRHDSHGYCANHARQYRKYGHPLSSEEKHENLSNAAKLRKPTLGKNWKIADTSKMKGRHYYITFKKNLPLGVIWGHNLNRRITS